MANKVTRSGLEYGNNSSELNKTFIKKNIVSIMNAKDSVKKKPSMVQAKMLTSKNF